MMSINHYGEFELQPGDYDKFFDEAIEAAEFRYGPLSKDAPSAAVSNPAAELLRELKEKRGETAEFAPHLSVLPLRKKDFAEQGFELPSRIKDLMRRYRFYLIRVPLTLMPRPGVVFRRVQCAIELNPDEEEVRKPSIHALFPTNRWETVIQAHQGLKIGLDEHITFKASLGETQLGTGPLSGVADLLIASGLSASAGLVLGEFKYSIRRPKVISAGEGNVKARWFLDSKEIFEPEDFWLGTAIQVPKDTKVVNVAGALLAYRSLQWLTADLRDLFDLLSEGASEFFNLGAPIPDTMVWRDILEM
jgi:hypothetical protein